MTTALTIAVESGPLLLERARDLALKATTVDEAKDIRDQLAAIAVYMRARGASDETMKYANKAKLWTERRLGQLTRVMPKKAGRRTDKPRDKVSPGCETKKEALTERHITKKQAQRWEKLATLTDEEFSKLVDKKVDAALRAAEKATEKGATHVSHNSGEVEWYTPPEYIEAARKVMGGIDLDPASCELANRTVKAKHFYSKDDDGLSMQWKGRVWMNPPYASGVVDAFAEKLAAETRVKHVDAACVLVNNATETAWGQKLADIASAVCFPSGRISYLDATGKPANTPLQGQAIFYVGSDTKRFVDGFGQIGVCWVKP